MTRGALVDCMGRQWRSGSHGSSGVSGSAKPGAFMLASAVGGLAMDYVRTGGEHSGHGESGFQRERRDGGCG
jgi:hypothetical protein